MFSSPTPAPGSRTIAGRAFRKAGLIDQDAQMSDATDKPGGRKGSSKIRSHRPRAIDAYKDGPSRTRLIHRPLLNVRLHALLKEAHQIHFQYEAQLVRLPLADYDEMHTSAGPSLIPVRTPTRMKTGGVESWRKLVQKRWNAEARLLDLSNLIDDEIVKNNKLEPPGYGGGAREAAVILKLAKELKPEVQSLDLSNNKWSGQDLAVLGHYLPQLANLSLNNNNIRLYRDLDHVAGRKGKLLVLRELILTGNPLREDELKKGKGEHFTREVTKRFPSLAVLDGQRISAISFDVPQASTSSTPPDKPSSTTFPLNMGGPLIVGVDPGLITQFLMRYFSLFDTNRPALQNVYDPTARYSFAVNTTIPERARTQGLHTRLPNQKKLDWSQWLSNSTGGSRNLMRLGNSIEKQEQRLYIGGQSIVDSFKGLPQTKHDLGGPAEKFSVDCFPVAHAGIMGLLTIVHGEFTELPAEGLRSFDRTFLLVPAPENSQAKAGGWDIVIVSDQLMVRGYSGPDAWKPGPMVVQPEPQAAHRHPPSQQQAPTPQGSSQSTPALPQDQQAVLMTIPEPQRSLVVQVCARTGLNVKFAVDCLTGNAWDLEKAVNNFNEVKFLCVSHLASSLAVLVSRAP
ncbi:nuclear mRNA export, poly(A)+RNA binding protein [Marasmius crinis-equi]|uniref:Nuclear mRNA export, poly(A)+RNA binding protein n=1 Tax=Marasmius crinis-equi TaxID=585013 RepID=A0ABR3FR95_9AGAR